MRQEKNSGGSSPCWTSSEAQSIVAPVEAGRRPGLETREGKAGGLEAQRQRDRSRIAESPGGGARLPEMDDAAQEGAGGDDDGAAGKSAAVGERHARDRPGVRQEAGGFAFDDRETGRLADQPLHGAPVKRAVGLRPRALDGRALAAIEDAELDAGQVRGARHQAVERVDLAHEMAFAEPADRRVARHFADGGEPVGDERGRAPQRAAAAAASQPACPPPITMTSKPGSGACFT